MTDPTALPFDNPPPSKPQRKSRVFTVTTLTAAIRTMLETTYREVWVEGEISNARVWKTGHLYFTLKDTSTQINAVMFRSTVRYLRFKPENGQFVLARGRVSVYDPKGEYQIVCEHLEPKGLGTLQLAFEQLRERLDHEGLFDASRKRPLPVLPKKIGIVTSLDGAAVKDILNVLGRRHPSAHLIISPTRVQGEGAAREIVRALRNLERLAGVDVIIVEDDSPVEDKSEKKLRRIISECSLFVPVISEHSMTPRRRFFQKEWVDTILEARRNVNSGRFILPVAIDDTSPRAAVMPKVFGELEWERLPSGEPSPEFVETVVQLQRNYRSGSSA